MDFLGVITKMDWFRWLFLCILGYFLKVMYRMGIFLGIAKISNIFWGMPDVPDIFFA